MSAGAAPERLMVHVTMALRRAGLQLQLRSTGHTHSTDRPIDFCGNSVLSQLPRPPHLTHLLSFYTCVNVTHDTSHLPLASPHLFSHHLIIIISTSHSRAATPLFSLLRCSFSAHLLPILTPFIRVLFHSFFSLFQDCCQRDSRFRNGSEGFLGGVFYQGREGDTRRH